MASIHSPFFTCLSYRIQKRKKATTFKLMKLLKHTQKHAVTTEDRILIRHYRLDKSIGPENRPISRVVIGREVDYRSRLIYVRYCLTNTTLCL